MCVCAARPRCNSQWSFALAMLFVPLATMLRTCFGVLSFKHIYMQIPRQPLKFFGTMISSGLERQFIPADPRAAVLPEELIPEGSVPLSGQGQPDYCLPFDLDGVRFHWN